MIRFNLDDRQIRFLVAADDFCGVLGLVVETDLNFGRLIDHVMVRDDVSGLVDDETRAQIPHRLVAVWKIRRPKEIEEIERIEFSVIGRAVPVRAAANGILDGRFGIDVHHGRIEARGDL